MAWTLCTSSSAVMKAGTHCSSISGSAIAMAEWSEDAEGFICAYCHSDFVGTLPADTRIQKALSDVCSSKIAMSIIAYDTTGYLTREADTLMNYNDNIINKGLAVLKDKTFQKLT